jgi:hypothetical protein
MEATASGPMRSQDELVAEYEAIGSYEQRALSEEFQNFLSGARAAIGWVLGHTVHSPASERIGPATVATMHAEERYCDTVIYSDDPRPVIDRDFANGVEHALSWARGAEEHPPAPLEVVVAQTHMCACG